MKTPGSQCDYIRERTDDLMRAYREVVDRMFSGNAHVRSSTIYDTVVTMPSKRFWVSPERASIVLSRIFQGTCPKLSKNKRMMFDELARRVKALKQECPKTPLLYLVEKVILQPAPSFYMSPCSARIEIQREKKCRLKTMKQRLRHLL